MTHLIVVSAEQFGKLKSEQIMHHLLKLNKVRTFKTGEVVIFQEQSDEDGPLTGEESHKEITEISSSDNAKGLKEGYAILAFGNPPMEDLGF